jgi:hypothetical protein
MESHVNQKNTSIHPIICAVKEKRDNSNLAIARAVVYAREQITETVRSEIHHDRIESVLKIDYMGNGYREAH